MLIIPVGLPGSGKSSFADTLNGIEIISPDEIRLEVYDGYPSELIREKEEEVWRVAYKRLENSNENVYFDATNLTIARRKVLLQKKPGKSKAIFFNVPVNICLKRNKKRDKIIPRKVIIAMADKLEEPSFEEGFDLVEVKRR